jgi:muramoyltetrapeptide carboxypeptidase
MSRKGKAKGILTGGNLDVLCSLIGSVSDIDTSGKILFIEEIGEHLYRIDRMMWMLKRAGKLDNLAGLIVGGFTDIPDEASVFGKTANEIIAEAVENYTYPVCFGFPAGHHEDNRALIFGREVVLDVGDKVSLQF